MEITEDEIKNFEQIYIVACGSAWHVGMAAQYVLEDIADIPVRVELASEFRYRKMPLNQKALVIVVSQSGETADTLAALRLAKEKGITTMAIVNVVGSSIAREADKVFYTLAGPEISVATTKAYSAQLAAMYCMAVQFAKVRGKITEEQYSYYISELLTLPEKMQKTLEDKERIQWFAAKYANAHDVFFVGRGIDYAVCLEGSLKLKEISYIHSEAYAAGELKHGTISLIEQGTLVIGVLTQSELYEKTISNMLECKSRGAYLMGLTTYGKYEIEDQVNFTVYAYEPTAAGKGWKSAIVTWYQKFKESVLFRKMFLLVFVTSMILFRTLLNRNLWLNPLSNVMGGWGIWETVNGEQKLTTECIENVIMMVPFTSMVIWTFQEKVGSSWKKILWYSGKIAFIFSISIEVLQLFLRLGTFQLSDLFYNTVGGMIGGLMYYGITKGKKRL